jgi:hypothetical protein
MAAAANCPTSCKAGGPTAGFVFKQFSHRNAFIAHSPNKSGGTGNRAEHHAWPAVVGVGNA